MLVDIRQNKARSRGIYLNPYIGDLSQDLVEAIYKCQYMDQQKDNYNGELNSLLKSWCDYVVQNWDALERGQYKNLKRRPLFNYKQLLTQEIFVANIPDVEKDQELLKKLQK